MDIGNINVVIEGGLTSELPPLIPVEQHFERTRIDDIGATVTGLMEAIPTEAIEGKSIAVTVGSRAITGLVEVLRALFADLCAKGGRPFAVPAMGSHGGATAAGQLAMLAGYGITEATLGVPIRASMDVVKQGELDDGTAALAVAGIPFAVRGDNRRGHHADRCRCGLEK